MDLNEWKLQVEEWRKKYPYKVDITRTGVYSECEVCHKTRAQAEIHRHHIASDYIFARMYPEKYAARYIQFRREDCVGLCTKHHESVEKYYAPTKLSLFNQLNDEGRLPPEKCEKFRQRLVKAYHRWRKRINTRSKRKRKRK